MSTFDENHHAFDENHRSATATSTTSSSYGTSTTMTRREQPAVTTSALPTRETIPVLETTLIGHHHHHPHEMSLLDTFLKAANACDKFFNCAYVTKQLEEEWHQETNSIQGFQEHLNHGSSIMMTSTATTTTAPCAMNRVWNKMEKSFQVEVYRQFLFDESSFDDNSDRDDDDEVPAAAAAVAGHDGNNLSTLLPFSCGNDDDVTSIPDLTRTRS